jgi:hypothetical protein
MTDLFAWWNLLFALPFGLALLYVLLLAAGLASVDHDAGDADMDGLDHGDGFGHGDGHDADGQHLGAAGAVLSALGVGRVPLPIVFTCLAFSWGFTGWAANLVLSRTPVVDAFFPLISLPLAGAVSLLFTATATRLLARVLPSTESYGARNHDLVGRLADARFTITESFGRAVLHDARGTLLEVTCRVQPGEAALPAGSRVLLFAYDRETDSFLACPDPTFDAKAGGGHSFDSTP